MPSSHINQCCPSDAHTILPSGEHVAPASPEAVESLELAGAAILAVAVGVVGLSADVVTVAKPDITTMVPAVDAETLVFSAPGVVLGSASVVGSGAGTAEVDISVMMEEAASLETGSCAGSVVLVAREGTPLF